ncbi:MAG: hypothetical protein HY929_04680 [Euryarchaeota archaeon]|nr:hypothetical protein [Euryarchaeota archaeon]
MVLEVGQVRDRVWSTEKKVADFDQLLKSNQEIIIRIEELKTAGITNQIAEFLRTSPYIQAQLKRALDMAEEIKETYVSKFVTATNSIESLEEETRALRKAYDELKARVAGLSIFSPESTKELTDSYKFLLREVTVLRDELEKLKDLATITEGKIPIDPAEFKKLQELWKIKPEINAIKSEIKTLSEKAPSTPSINEKTIKTLLASEISKLEDKVNRINLRLDTSIGELSALKEKADGLAEMASKTLTPELTFKQAVANFSQELEKLKKEISSIKEEKIRRKVGGRRKISKKI